VIGQPFTAHISCDKDFLYFPMVPVCNPDEYYEITLMNEDETARVSFTLNIKKQRVRRIVGPVSDREYPIRGANKNSMVEKKAILEVKDSGRVNPHEGNIVPICYQYIK
jgi:hypothetical protein